MEPGRQLGLFGLLGHGLLVAVGAVVMTLLFFLVLPLVQVIGKPPSTDLIVQSVDTTNLPPPPPPPPEEEQKEEPEPEEQAPELLEEAPPLDLSQLELALSPGLGEGWLGGDFAVKLNTAVTGSKEMDELFTIADLDQKPRITYQPGPVWNAGLRKHAPGTVYVLFVVDREGRVSEPRIQSSTDPVFERPAMSAVQKWRFEPGMRNGEPVSFRMRVPITFPKG